MNPSSPIWRTRSSGNFLTLVEIARPGGDHLVGEAAGHVAHLKVLFFQKQHRDGLHVGAERPARGPVGEVLAIGDFSAGVVLARVRSDPVRRRTTKPSMDDREALHGGPVYVSQP
jgi:hypothetical protein